MNAVLTEHPLLEKLSLQTKRNKNSYPLLRSYLDFAWDTFRKYGFPSNKNEEWKYFSWKKILTESLRLSTKKTLDKSRVYSILKNYPEEADLWVFYNGIFQNDLSVLKNSVKISPFANLSEDKLLQVGNVLNIDVRTAEALNTAAFTSGTYIEVAEQPKFPVYCLYFFDTDTDLFLQPRFFWEIHTNISLKIYEQVFSFSQVPIITNSVTEGTLGENSELLWERFYDYSGNLTLINTTVIKQERSSKTQNTVIAMQEGRLRNNYEVLLAGEEAFASLFGFSYGKSENFTDHHTSVSHISENCKSFQLYKGIAKDRSTIVFNGKIYVFPEAQKTDAFQENHHKLLSYDANVFTKPQLEILADDVKCSHGATIGKIDENQIFYSKSRGIPEEKARQILLNAFASEIFNLLENDYFRKRISETFSI